MKEILTHAEFNKLISEEEKLVVVDFFATWCGPCKIMGPVLEGWADNEFKDVLFVKIDVDNNVETPEECNISAMPTFQLFKKGTKVGEIVGANKQKLKELIEQNK